LLGIGVIIAIGVAVGCTTQSHDGAIVGCNDETCGAITTPRRHVDAGLDASEAGDALVDALDGEAEAGPTTMELVGTVTNTTRIEFDVGGVVPTVGLVAKSTTVSAAADPTTGIFDLLNVPYVSPITYVDVANGPNIFTRYGSDRFLPGGRYTFTVPIVQPDFLQTEGSALGYAGDTNSTGTLLIQVNATPAVGATAAPAGSTIPPPTTGISAGVAVVGPIYSDSAGDLSLVPVKLEGTRLAYFGLDPAVPPTITVSQGTLKASVTPPLVAGTVTFVVLTPR
jgi:hypothetical protein